MSDTKDFAKHRTMISHALKGEPAQMKPIFNEIIRQKIGRAIEIRRAEMGANLFGGKQE